MSYLDRRSELHMSDHPFMQITLCCASEKGHIGLTVTGLYSSTHHVWLCCGNQEHCGRPEAAQRQGGCTYLEKMRRRHLFQTWCSVAIKVALLIIK